MLTLDDLHIEDRPDGKRRALVRADFNVPLDTTEAGSVHITDDGRIVAALPTIRALIEAGSSVVLVAHLGRPKGKPVEGLSLRPVGERLAELLGRPVHFAADVTGADAHRVVESLGSGDIALLENVRFDARETSKDPAVRDELAAELAAFADVFVSDGFGVVHREQASVTEVARRLPHAAGLLVAREVDVFSKLLADPDRPYVVVLGGSKVSDKLGVIDRLLDSVDRLLIGGGMCFTFLAALGHDVGDSLLEADQLDTVRGFIERARQGGVDLVLPVDFVAARGFSADAEHRTVDADGLSAGWMGLDIGPKSADLFASKLSDAKTVVWNGPMGVFEMDPYAAGTREVAEAITRVEGMTVVGGGDSAAAVRLLGIPDSGFSHISTGGGASLEFLEGATLPGLAVLDEPFEESAT